MIIITTADGSSYPIDLALEERLAYTAEVSENEVEKGAAITDHIRPKQPVLSFDGVVSDTPIGRVAQDPSRQVSAGSPLPSMDAFQRFEAIHKAGEPVTVKCSYGTFDSMALANLTPTKDSKSAKAFKFTAEFRRIKIVENKRVTVRTAVRNGNARQSLGNRESQAWQSKLGSPAGSVYVFSRPTSGRAAYSKVYGAPYWSDADAVTYDTIYDTTKSKGTDYFQIFAALKPDGFLTANGAGSGSGTGKAYTYHPLQRAGVGDVSTPEIQGRPVHFDSASNSWRDDRDNSIVRTVPTRPGSPTFEKDRWDGVTHGAPTPGVAYGS